MAAPRFAQFFCDSLNIKYSRGRVNGKGNRDEAPQATDFYYDSRQRRGGAEAFSALKKKLVRIVGGVYNRGLSSGYYLGKPLHQWTNGPGSRATTRKEHVGVVVNYCRKPGTVEIRVEGTGFTCGDEIMFQGPTTGVVVQIAESIEIRQVRVEHARKGQHVAVKARRQVRPHDKVYVIRAQGGVSAAF